MKKWVKFIYQVMEPFFSKRVRQPRAISVQRRQFAPLSVEPAKRRLQILDRQVQASPPSVVPANVPRPGKVSAQEVLEATRRANEAMGVIEGSTPEM